MSILQSPGSGYHTLTVRPSESQKRLYLNILQAHVDNPLPAVQRRDVVQYLPGKETHLLGFCDIFIVNYLKTTKKMNFKEVDF